MYSTSGEEAEIMVTGISILYDLIYRVKDMSGNIVDEVHSYAGMRKVHTANGIFYLNNQPYFQRLVLDQGYYPDGIWTAPSDEALKNDIMLGKAQVSMAPVFTKRYSKKDTITGQTN